MSLVVREKEREGKEMKGKEGDPAVSRNGSWHNYWAQPIVI
jgi:hypothetical protein